MVNYEFAVPQGDLTIILYNNNEEALRVLLDSGRLLQVIDYTLLLQKIYYACDQEGNKIMKLYDHDANAFLTLVCILQGAYDMLPLRIDLKQLVEIASLTELFGAHDAVRQFVQGWVEALKPTITRKLCPDTLCLLYISETFRLTDIYYDMWQIIFVQSDAQLFPSSITAHNDVLEEIELFRQLSIDELHI